MNGGSRQFDILTKVGCFNRITTYRLSEVTDSNYRHNSGGDSGNDRSTSFYEYVITLRIAGHWLPYVLDLRARHIDRRGLAGIAKKAVLEWNSDPAASIG